MNVNHWLSRVRNLRLHCMEADPVRQRQSLRRSNGEMTVSNGLRGYPLLIAQGRFG
jgi:hypothetical protein